MQKRNQRRTSRLGYLQPPYNPGMGAFEQLQRSYPYYPAMMQVIEADTHENYVVCRGWDAEHNMFLTSVPVAKPYGERGTTGTYAVGEIHPAIKPMTVIGATPGKGETSTGHPSDLDEKIVALQTDEGIYVSWMFVSGGNSSGFRVAKITSGGSATYPTESQADGFAAALTTG